jgi:hypothetical protein
MEDKNMKITDLKVGDLVFVNSKTSLFVGKAKIETIYDNQKDHEPSITVKPYNSQRTKSVVVSIEDIKKKL